MKVFLLRLRIRARTWSSIQFGYCPRSTGLFAEHPVACGECSYRQVDKTVYDQERKEAGVEDVPEENAPYGRGDAETGGDDANRMRTTPVNSPGLTLIQPKMLRRILTQLDHHWYPQTVVTEFLEKNAQPMTSCHLPFPSQALPS